MISLSAKGETPSVCNCAGWKPRSDGGDPGSGPDPGTAANHPPGCNSHSRSWSAANAGSHAQRPGPALPLHSHPPILISRNFSAHSDPSSPNVNADSSHNPCASPDGSLGPRPNPNAIPRTRPNANAKLGAHIPCANPSCSRYHPVISPCTVSNIHSCAGPASRCSPGLHTSLCPRTTPSGKNCAYPVTKCRPGHVSDSLRLSFNPCANPGLHPRPRFIPYTNPNCSVAPCPGTRRASSPDPDPCLQPCPCFSPGLSQGGPDVCFPLSSLACPSSNPGSCSGLCSRPSCCVHHPYRCPVPSQSSHPNPGHGTGSPSRCCGQRCSHTSHRHLYNTLSAR